MERIAVIGLGCRFPGAGDVPSFWRLLDEGADAITEVPADRWDVAAFYDPDPAKPGKVSTRWGGFLVGVDEFDPAFFGISRREAASMDPQQRLLLEVAWEAIETAGYSPAGLGGSRTGVFVGISGSDYGRLLNRPDLLDAYAVTGNALSIAANRLSYLLDLRGPSMAVDTACSSSLVAVHLACESLRHRESDLVIAGGVSVILSPELSVAFSKARMLAADGRCKAFDARADGYVRGEGCGVVVLKRFTDAVRDADHIVAVIRGSAVCQDGMSNGLTAPNGPAQQAVIREALRRADVPPGRVGYVEAHGTGTPLGDPIELQALAAVLRAGRREGDPLAVGSVKTNIGHLEAAAGIAGLIKTILALNHEKIPSHLHLKERNPRIPPEARWLAIPGQGLPWPRGRRSRFAGTSSFGFGGTNAHVVLEEAPAVRPRQSAGTDADRPLHLLALSARTGESLRELARRFAERRPLTGRSESLADICYTANVSRSAHHYRFAAVAASTAELVASLRLFADGKAPAAPPGGPAGNQAQPKVAFLFTGQGSQYTGMGRLLDQTQPAFRRALDACEKVLDPCLERPLRSVLYGDAGLKLDQAIYTQAALFSVEYALAAMWRSWGIVPEIVAGHSLGEYAAACIAGVFSLEEGLNLMVARGRSMQALPQDGAMAAVHTEVVRVAELLEADAGGVTIAAVNGPRNVVISGREKAVGAVLAALEDEGVACQALKVSHAFHSPLMEPILADVEAACGGIRFSRPKVAMVSTLTGQMLGPAEIPGASYWRRQTRGAVRFAAAVESLIAVGVTAVVEIGPHPVLLGLVSEITGSSALLRLPTLARGQDDWRMVLDSLAVLYTHGISVDWPGFDRDYHRRRVFLPTYPFRRERCWIGRDGPAAAAETVRPAPANITQPRTGHPLLGIRERSAWPHAQFESRLSTRYPAFLDDHRVQEACLLPGTAYLEMALAAAREVGRAPGLSDTTFHRPLVLGGERPRVVQITLDPPQASGDVQFRISSLASERPDAQVNWLLHVTGRLAPVDRNVPSSAPPEELRARCDQRAADLHYARLRDRGLDYGPAFRGVRALWRRDGEALGRIRLDAEPDPAAAFVIHPALLDACLQVLAAALPDEAAAAHPGETYLPVALQGLRVYRPPGDQAWSHALLRSAPKHPGDTIEGDVRLLDDSGSVMVEALGLCLQRLGTARADDITGPDGCRYDIRWRPAPRIRKATVGPGPSHAGTWLLLSDDDVGARLRTALEARGGNCIEVLPATCAASSGRRRWVDPRRPEDFDKLIGETLDTGGTACRGIVHLWGLRVTSVEETTAAGLEADQVRCCGSVLHALRALAKASCQDPPRLWVVTRGAQPIGRVTGPIAAEQAPLWGLGRSAALEHPELWGGLLDLDPGARGGEESFLLEQLLEAGGENQAGFRGGRRYVPRLVRGVTPEEPAQPTPLPLRSSGTYLITGGLGGVGLQIAHRIAERGARRLVLAGRTALPERPAWPALAAEHPARARVQAIEAMERLGASVTVAQADVADEAAVARLLDRLARELPPLTGVIHAAGVIEPGALDRMPAASLARVLRPKVAGACLLHCLTRHLPLDIFAVCSSVSSVWGSANLGHYAAANAFLDALTHHRRVLGLPASCINWGPWAGIGMAADPAAARLLGLAGLRPLSPGHALDDLERLLQGGPAQQIVADVDWSIFAPLYQAGGRSGRLFERLENRTSRRRAARKRSAPRTASPAAEVLRQTAGRAERHAWVLARLHEQLARILGMEPHDDLDRDQPVNTMGLDSLMAIELKNAIEANIGVTVPMVTFLEGPTLARLGDDILRLLEGAPQPVQARLVPSAAAAGDHPLSFGQRALWFLHHLSPDAATAYTISGAVRIRARVDPAVLQRCFQRLVDRHPSLRTTFPAADGRPIQRVHESQRVLMETVDGTSWSQAILAAHVAEAARRPFDLDSGPLLRLTLFVTPAAEAVLLLTVHHLVADFWSLVVLVHELGVLYPAELADVPAPLPPLGLTYTDYARWQAELIDGPEGKRLWAYWRKQMRGELPVLDLPADRPRPPVQTYRGASLGFDLDAELSRRLKALGQASQATPYMTLLAAFAVLLARYAGQQEIIVGSPSAGRNHHDVAGVVGYFVNPLALRLDLSGDPSFEQLLARVRRTVLAAFAHQDFPFGVLVQRLQPARSPRFPPLFQVMFVLQKAQLLDDQGLTPFVLGEPGSRMELGGLPIESVGLQQRAAQFDLTLVMAEAGGRLSGSFEYNTDLFDRVTVERMLGHLVTLLEGIVADPGRRVGALPLLARAERRQLAAWNRTGAPYPAQTVAGLFQAQVRRTPEAVAVLADGVRLSYRELDQRANRLAHHLCSLGVGPEVVVGLCGRRSADTVVGLLGILKAGGAYLPLDLVLPAERLAFMAADAGVSVLVAGSVPAGVDPAGLVSAGTAVVRLAADGGLLAGYSGEDPPAGGSMDDLAYVIYTSGSTGTPKGVAVPHLGLANFTQAAGEAFRLGSDDRVLQFASLSVDTAAEEIFPCLTRGAALALWPRPASPSIPELLGACDRLGLTVLDLPSPYWHQLVDYLGEADARLPGSVRLIVVGGDVIRPARVRRWRERIHPDVRLVNTYGPTEATVAATMCDLTGEGGADVVPIGRPIANVRVYVLDGRMRLVPVGVPGELCVGGIGLARGYLNRDAETARQFVPDPFARRPGARLYRTGDVARWRPDGALELLGRADQQVKVRGFRVELGEVEVALGRHPRVAEAVVVAADGPAGDRRLVAYVVAAGPLPAPAEELRGFVRGVLPDYMVPAVVVVLDALPRTPSGKVDRAALPAAGPPVAGAGSRAAPRSPVEAALAGIWAEVLGVDQVGVHDNFFELGGDSIQSIQISARAGQDGIALTPTDIFQHQSIAALAAAARSVRVETSGREPAPRTAPLTPIQHWFFEQALRNPHHFNQALLLELHPESDPATLRRAWAAVLAHHDALRLRFRRQDAGWQQAVAGWSDDIPFAEVELSSAGRTARARAITRAAAELQASLNISTGPLALAGYLRLPADQPARLLLAIHHLAVDGLSWRILLEDLQAAYEQLRAGEEICLPRATSPFLEYAAQLPRHAQSDAVREELAYWMAVPADRPAPIPVDYVRGVNRSGSASAVEASLTVEETRALLLEIPRAYRAGANDALLAAVALACARWTGSRRLLVDLETHGRGDFVGDVDVTRTVGWFTALYPVLLDLPDNGPGELLAAVKDQVRAIPSHGTGYGMLRYLSDDPQATALRSQLSAEVCFTYLGQFDQVLSAAAPYCLAREPAGRTSSWRNSRSHLLEVTAAVIGGRLTMTWTFSRNVHSRATIQRLAGDCLETLRSILGHCRSVGSPHYTPRDFPLAGLDQSHLDRLVRDLRRPGIQGGV